MWEGKFQKIDNECQESIEKAQAHAKMPLPHAHHVASKSLQLLHQVRSQPVQIEKNVRGGGFVVRTFCLLQILAEFAPHLDPKVTL